METPVSPSQEGHCCSEDLVNTFSLQENDFRQTQDWTPVGTEAPLSKDMRISFTLCKYKCLLLQTPGHAVSQRGKVPSVSGTFTLKDVGFLLTPKHMKVLGEKGAVT